MIRKKQIFLFSCITLCILILAVPLTGLFGLNWLSIIPRLRPRPASQELFQGVHYFREVRNSPRPMVIHVISVDLRADGIRLLVTPGDPHEERPLKARTTSEFLGDFHVQVAINGSGFTPWYSHSLLDYYPKTGDPIEPIGIAASQGVIYSQNNEEQPVLYFSRTNQARFGTPLGKVYNAISGNQMIVQDGGVLPDLETVTQPRTAIGLDKRGRTLVIVLVDGRQPGYSEGATLEELGEILVAHGAYTAMNLDGGGSTTLVMSKSGRPVVLNSPINNGIPGRERPVGNHLGIFASPEK
jgi:exopolysaccharide biosynthesis protein